MAQSSDTEATLWSLRKEVETLTGQLRVAQQQRDHASRMGSLWLADRNQFEHAASQATLRIQEELTRHRRNLDQAQKLNHHEAQTHIAAICSGLETALRIIQGDAS